MNKSAACDLAGRHNATAVNTVAVVVRTKHKDYHPSDKAKLLDNWWDVEIRYKERRDTRCF